MLVCCNKKDSILSRLRYYKANNHQVNTRGGQRKSSKKRRFVDIKAADKRAKKKFCSLGLIILSFDAIPRLAICFHCLRGCFLSRHITL